MNKIIYITFFLIFAGLTACTDADKFYNEQELQPEIMADFEAVYAIGDTLTISGRLNPGNNFEIRVGSVKAEVISLAVEEVQDNRYGLTLDVAKIIITEEMGIGEDRPVTITSAGITINAPAIEIVGDVDAALLDKPLQLVKIADIPAGAQPVYCRSGNGNVYVWQGAGKKLFKIAAADGSVTEVFSENDCTDAGGIFTIEEFNAGAVSPGEQYFYFSAKVKETGQPRTAELYKLCRFDMQRGEFTTLNRTVYPSFPENRTLASAKPFEGKINEVKIYKITAIWPDTEGNVYCNLMGHFLTLLDVDNNYRYLANITEGLTNYGANDFIPLINDAATNSYYSAVQIHQLFPGAKIKCRISYLDTETRRLYSKTSSVGTLSLRVIDLKTLIITGEYANNWLDVNKYDIPYATASLKRFNGGLVDNQSFDPIVIEGKLYNIFFTDLLNLSEGSNAKKFYQNYALPAVCVIDLENNRAVRLAPGKLEYNGFVISQFYDRLLNFDNGKMLYMTANSGTVIVKTTAVND
ncbi:MAG: hypothetical protein AB2L24_23865 [Mangrovibacterium sp.]